MEQKMPETPAAPPAAVPSSAANGPEAPAGKPRPAFSITPKAAEKLKALMAEQKKDPATTGLRIGVQGGGCSGLQYFMDFDEQKPNDRVFEQDGVKVFIDPRSILHVSGSFLEFAEGLMGSGFAIKNPNVKGSCGCGHSFTT